MKIILKLAWKNIWRNKLRSSLIIISVIIGLVAGVFIVGFMNGFVEEKIKSVIDIEIPHLQINTKKYLEQSDIENNFSFPILEKTILSNNNVKGISPRIIINSMISSSYKIGGIQVYGIIPEKEKTISKLNEYIKDSMGNYFKDNIPYSIIISKKISEKYKLKLKSKLILSMVDTSGRQVSAAFRVCGIYNIGNSIFEESKVFVRAEDLRELTNLPKDNIHEIAIKLKDDKISTLNKTEKEIGVLLNQDKTIRNWKEIDPMMGYYNDFMNIELMIIIAIILFGLGFGIVNTILMSVMERKRELSMLMAIGMNKKKVLELIIIESTILTSIGGFIGMIIGYIIIIILNKTGLDISSSMGSVGEYGFSTLIHPSITLFQFISIAIMVILTGILSAIYPAKSAIKLNPAQGVRK